MALPNVAFSGNGAQFVVGTRKTSPLGTAMYFVDGRKFRFGQAAATAIATAKLTQQTLNDAEWDELVVPTARAAGVTTVTVTNGTTVISNDQFVDGWLNVEDDTGEGYLYSVASNSGAANAGTLTVNLNEPLQVAWTTSTTVGMFASPYAAVVVAVATGATALLTGVTPRVIPVSNFGWFQTWGPCSVTVEGTVIINERALDSASVAGAVAPTASTAAGEQNYVGVVMEVAADTEQGIVWLRLS
jgi:hypothetical protein